MTLEVAITHRFEGFALDAAFTAGDGVTALFGRSGAGKSTIINALAGLLRPDRGRIALGGRVLFDAAGRVDMPVHRRRIGTIFQDGRLFPHLNVAGNLAFARLFAPRDRGAIDEAEIVGLLGLQPLMKRRPGELSGGEKQRAAIARALFMRPKLLLLDEPLAGLDEARKAQILPYLERLRDEVGLPMIYVSHSVSEVVRLAERVVMLREGRTVASGPVAEVFADLEAVRMMGPRDAGAVLAGKVARHDAADGLTEVALASGPLVLPQMEAAVGAHVRVRVRASDVILSLGEPVGLSTRNVIAATILAVREGEGPGALVELGAGPDRLVARLTRRAVRTLRLAPGMNCFAILKAVAVAPEDVTVTSASSEGDMEL